MAHQSPLGIFDDPRYAKLALDNAERYQNAKPFPHIAFDGFVDEGIAHSVAESFPGPEDIDWIVCKNANTVKRFQHDETKISPYLRQMLREFNSRQFVLFVETLTGIESLIADPYFSGGGIHLAGRDDFLKVHVDFNWHHKLQAHRRVNVLFYANPGWQEEWGGHIELWNKDMNGAAAKYLPSFNRVLIFSTSEDSNHGHPYPLGCPDAVFRRTLNLYYYTTRRDAFEVVTPHFTVYKSDPFAKDLERAYRDSALSVSTNGSAAAPPLSVDTAPLDGVANGVAAGAATDTAPDGA